MGPLSAICRATRVRNTAALTGNSSALARCGINGQGLASAAARGALRSAITQGIGVTVGLQSNFSWAGVAAAGVSAGVTHQIAGSKWIQGFHDDTHGAILGAAGAAANAATRSLIDGSDFGDNLIAALPDVIGNTIGEMIAGGVAESVERKRLMAAKEKVNVDQSETGATDSQASSGAITLAYNDGGGSGAIDLLRPRLIDLGYYDDEGLPIAPWNVDDSDLNGDGDVTADELLFVNALTTTSPPNQGQFGNPTAQQIADYQFMLDNRSLMSEVTRILIDNGGELLTPSLGQLDLDGQLTMRVGINYQEYRSISIPIDMVVSERQLLTVTYVARQPGSQYITTHFIPRTEEFFEVYAIPSELGRQVLGSQVSRPSTTIDGRRMTLVVIAADGSYAPAWNANSVPAIDGSTGQDASPFVLSFRSRDFVMNAAPLIGFGGARSSMNNQSGAIGRRGYRPQTLEFNYGSMRHHRVGPPGTPGRGQFISFEQAAREASSNRIMPTAARVSSLNYASGFARDTVSRSAQEVIAALERARQRYSGG